MKNNFLILPFIITSFLCLTACIPEEELPVIEEPISQQITLSVKSIVTNLYPFDTNVPAGISDGDTIELQIDLDFTEIQGVQEVSGSRITDVCYEGSENVFATQYSLPTNQEAVIVYESGYEEIFPITAIEVFDCGIDEFGSTGYDFIHFINNNGNKPESFEISKLVGNWLVGPNENNLQDFLNRIDNTTGVISSYYWENQDNGSDPIWGTYHQNNIEISIIDL